MVAGWSDALAVVVVVGVAPRVLRLLGDVGGVGAVLDAFVGGFSAVVLSLVLLLLLASLSFCFCFNVAVASASTAGKNVPTC